MWKRLKVLKLLTLVVVTVLLAWVTYPTWQPLVANRTPPAWRDEDQLQILILDRQGWSGTFQATGMIESSSETAASSPILTTQLNIEFLYHGSRPRPEDPPIYLLAAGKAQPWINDCWTPNTEPLPMGMFRKVQSQHLTRITPPAEVLAARTFVAPDSVIQIYGGILSCTIPEDGAWTSRGARHEFSPPEISIMALEPADPHKIVVVYPGENEGKTGTYCGRYDLNYGPGVNIDYQYPTSETPTFGTPHGAIAAFTSPYYLEDLKPLSAMQALDWAECFTPDVARAPDPRAVGVHPSAVKIQLTDINQDLDLQKKIFFAGVFAGILGALLIEIFNGIFDVAEHWSARRARRTEQEQTPDPDGAPEPPQPEHDVDHDQLPLF